MKSNASDRPPTDATGEDLATAVARARQQQPVLDALGEVYRGVDAEIDRAGLTCMGGGVCCRFDIAGHRLYATTLELAYLLAGGSPGQAAAPGRCPYQVGPRCAARAARPLGCRAYFCRPGAAEVTGGLYDRPHHHIQLLHNDFRIPYHYVELTGALTKLG